MPNLLMSGPGSILSRIIGKVSFISCHDSPGEKYTRIVVWYLDSISFEFLKPYSRAILELFSR